MSGRVSFEIQLDESLLRELDEAAKRAIEQTADATLTAIREAGVMPRNTGTKQNDQTSVEVDGDNVSIVTTAEQAARLYFHPEYNFNRTKNTRAGGKWFEPWISGSEKDFIEKTYAEMLRRNGGLQ